MCENSHTTVTSNRSRRCIKDIQEVENVRTIFSHLFVCCEQMPSLLLNRILKHTSKLLTVVAKGFQASCKVAEVFRLVFLVWETTCVFKAALTCQISSGLYSITSVAFSSSKQLPASRSMFWMLIGASRYKTWVHPITQNYHHWLLFS